MSVRGVFGRRATRVRDIDIFRRSVRAYGRGFSREKREKREKEAEGVNGELFVVGETNPARDDPTPPTTTMAPARDQVVAACLSTSAVLGVVGVGIYLLAPYISPAKGTGAFDTLHAGSLIGEISLNSIAATLATAGAVTGARMLLLNVWDDFRAATNTANGQVLLPLVGGDGGVADIALVGSLPALAEEFLFRFALLPAISPDWRGAVISGLVFGALHVNGGRNAAFAAWASAVGIAYGYLYLYTGSLAASAAAHAIANVLSAWLWTANLDHEGDDGGDDEVDDVI